ncbi:hypothetical protein BC835DRAFT_168631 [Cytidiella melzeri]|nr:hypothetical protein BC835DRAFT_168631 [Cytidiella melzeri]
MTKLLCTSLHRLKTREGLVRIDKLPLYPVGNNSDFADWHKRLLSLAVRMVCVQPALTAKRSFRRAPQWTLQIPRQSSVPRAVLPWPLSSSSAIGVDVSAYDQLDKRGVTYTISESMPPFLESLSCHCREPPELLKVAPSAVLAAHRRRDSV